MSYLYANTTALFGMIPFVGDGATGARVFGRFADASNASFFIKHGDDVVEEVGNLVVKAGKNFKDHFIDHKKLLEKVLGTKYPKYKTDGMRFLNDIENAIKDGTFEYVGQGTLKKGHDACNIYKGKGLTIVIKPNGEFVTILEQGKGLDIGIQYIGK